jgi:hypothetical protein
MTHESIGYVPGAESSSIGTIGGDNSTAGSGRIARTGLTAHLHLSRRLHGGVPRWFAVAVLAGAFVALAFVNYLAR